MCVSPKTVKRLRDASAARRPAMGDSTRAFDRMTDDAINRLVEAHRKYRLPDAVMEREFALALVASGDPLFLLEIPEPWRTRVIAFGRDVNDRWLEISNNGTVDYSEHAKPLHALVVAFLREASIDRYIDRHGANEQPE